MSPATVVVLLTLLLGIQPITTDLYLPALPTVQASLGASIAAAQLTLSALVICFGLGQLVCGPLSDRFGRRPVLLGGLALYCVASVFGAAASSIEALIGWRALQGAAMAAAVTCGRSIIRDLYEPGEGARVMSRALSGLGIIAALSPLLGGLLIERLSWNLALLALALFGAGALAFVAWRFTETIPRRDPGATRLRRMLYNWAHVVANPTFRAWALLSACTYGGLFFLLAGSSFVFINVLGTSRVMYGAILGSISLAYIGGTMLCRRLLTRYGLRGAVKRGADIFATECSECHSARAGKNKKGPSLHAVIAGRGHIRPARRPLLAHKAQCRPEPHDPRKHFRRQAHVLAKEIQQAP